MSDEYDGSRVDDLEKRVQCEPKRTAVIVGD